MRFAARKESFGSLVYDRERNDYIPFDQDATTIFEESLKRPLPEIFEQMENRLNKQSFDTFIELCRSIELMNEDGKFTGEFVTPKPLPNILSAPLRVHLTITSECPLRCRHCSQETRDPYPNELSLEEIQKLLDEMSEMGCCEVSIGGGEPFMRNDLLPIITYARHKGISVSLSTTATAVSRVVAKKIAEVGLKSIRVSFDGSTEKSYDYYRGKKGSYRKAVRGIKTLREIFDKTPITLHTTLMKSNMTEILTLARMVQKLRLNVWSVDYIKPVGFASDAKALWLTKEEAADAYKNLTKIVDNTNIKMEMAHFPFRAQRKSTFLGFSCLGANLYAYVAANGQVGPCSFTARTSPAGNLRQKSLRELWTTSENFRKFRAFVSGNEGCARCMKLVTTNLNGAAEMAEKNCFVMPTATSAPAAVPT
ncbi:MAG: radical SAM protein [Candidatus Xenobia bacterium]